MDHGQEQTQPVLNQELDQLFLKETRGLGRSYIKTNETLVVSEESMLHVDLGSCVSVVLAGVGSKGLLWFGANHLFKCREAETDLALYHISTLQDMLYDKGVAEVKCVGVFGAGYKEKSLAREVAILNIKTVLETLALFNLRVEIFQTGFSQGITIYKSKSRNSVILRHRDITHNEVVYHELSLQALFHTK